MRSSQVVRASDCQCQSRNSPGFDPSILRHSEICGAADEAVLNTVHREKKIQKNPPVCLKDMLLKHLTDQLRQQLKDYLYYS
jgi:hypothetical protein